MIVVDQCLGGVRELLERFGLEAIQVPPGSAIDGSYWGESEAGLVGNRLYVRADTPLHSALHEASHYVCMDAARRSQLARDAGGDHAEENAVCYLQILLADELPTGAQRLCGDMDEWGYTFRLGSARAWFENDAEDAREWLIAHGIIDPGGRITWKRRD
ncbi:MAG: hypothetical protein ACREUC_03915 [Steroidobacteraceae bacterium]